MTWVPFVLTGLACSACTSRTDTPDAAASAAQASTSAAAETAPPGWDYSRALQLASSKGEKQPYRCMIVAETPYGQTRDVAIDLPPLGVSKISAEEVRIDASSGDAAARILTTAWTGIINQRSDMEQLRVRGCRPELAASKASLSDRPLEQYANLDSSRDVAFHYYAQKGGTPDYERLAKMYWPDFSAETDAFRKRDQLASITREIDAGVAAAKRNPYVHVAFGGTMGAYDFTGARYPLDALVGPDMSLHLGDQGDHVVFFAPSPRFASYVPADEAAARAIEANLADAGRSVTTDLYGKIEHADDRDGRPYVLVTPLRIDVRTQPISAAPTALFSISTP